MPLPSLTFAQTAGVYGTALDLLSRKEKKLSYSSLILPPFFFFPLNSFLDIDEGKF